MTAEQHLNCVYSFLLHNVNNRTLLVFPNKYDLNVIQRSLRFIFPSKKIVAFPPWDCLPYEMTSPSIDIVARRIQALFDMREGDAIIISNQYAVSQKLPPLEVLQHLCFSAKLGSTQSDILSYLEKTGYYAVPTASNSGEFANRGSLIDVVSYGIGFRLGFDLDELETIRIFDVNTQNSIGKASEAKLYSCSEAIDIGRCNLKNGVVLEFVQDGIRRQGLERFLHDIYPNTATILDYAGPAEIITVDIQQIYGDYIYNKLAEGNNQSQLYLSLQDINDLLTNNAKFMEYPEPITNFHSQALVKREDSSFGLIASAFRESAEKSNAKFSNKIVILCCTTAGSCDRAARALEAHSVQAVIIPNLGAAESRDFIYAAVMPLESGFIHNEYYFISEKELFGQIIVSKKHIKKSKLLLSSFEIGDIVVHEDYGIGCFNGMQNVVLGNKVHDFVSITYADDNKLLIPVENINLITKYGRSRYDEGVALDRLGGTMWQNRKARLKRKIYEISKTLIEVAAKRKEQEVDPIAPDNELYDKFCSVFPYVETEDQMNAINDIRSSLYSGNLMDRLICGEAGFGKTEVAIRAAFIVARNSDKIKYQVAILSPSTLLCSQNFQAFKDRLESFGCIIEQMSRVKGAKHNAMVAKKLESGEVDIVVATHTLLRNDLLFKNLKLLIIDEEQSFGVKQKEKLKNERPDIHVLSLSATPIPRTLYMALSGIKDLSIIATAPIEKGDIETIVCEYDEAVIFNAISREIHRRGQVFYICPKIQYMKDAISKLTTLFPLLNIQIAHGQMPVAQLESVMSQFFDGRLDILISTTIVECGLNVPNANTIIIENAQYLGISQLCQLRGRVGRHKNKGYAYVILPNTAKKDLMQRISIIKHVSSGFSLASHDMDERGFGNIMGHEQSGNIKDIGIELYQKMLEDEVNALKNNGVVSNINPEVNLGLSIAIPKNYVSDEEARLMLYRRAAEIETVEQIDEFAANMVDRFGSIPQESLNLLQTLKYKIRCKNARITRLAVNSNAIIISLFNNTFPDYDWLISLIMQSNGMIKVNAQQEIVIKRLGNDLGYLDKFIDQLTAQLTIISGNLI